MSSKGLVAAVGPRTIIEAVILEIMNSWIDDKEPAHAGSLGIVSFVITVDVTVDNNVGRKGVDV